MKEAIWAYLILILGVVVVVVISFVQRVTTTAEEDFYLGREVMQSAMIDAIDYGSYRTSGRIIMSEQKFVEVFIRRFAESVTNNKDYTLEFYDIYEEPPKATVRIKSTSGKEATVNMDSTDAEINTLLSGILETNYEQYFDQLSDSSGNQVSGVYTIERYVNNAVYAYKNETLNGNKIKIPANSVISLGLSKYIELSESESNEKYNTDIRNDLNKYSCRYSNGTVCKIYYNGESYFIPRNQLSYPTINDETTGEFNIHYKTKKVCASKTINTSNTKVVSLHSYQLNDTTKAYKEKSTSSKLNAEYGKCSIVSVVGDCKAGGSGFCELQNGGGYVKASNLSSNVDGCIIPTSENNNGSDALIDTDGSITGYDTVYYHSQKLYLVNEYADYSFDLNKNPSFIYSLSSDGWYGNDPETANDPVKIDSISIPTKDGYKFAGYYTEMNGEGYMVINSDGKIVNTIAHANSYDYFLSDDYIFAYFTKNNPSKIFTITLDKQNGSGGTSKIYEVYGSKYTSDSSGKTTLNSITVPTRSNFTFSGYYTAASDGTKYIDSNGKLVSSASSSHFNANGSLYARWTGNYYKITLNKNNGSGGSSTIYVQYNTGWYDSDKKSISKITIPTRSNYTFNGYYTAASGGTKIINSDGTFVAGKTTSFSAASTLYAHWTKKITCGSDSDDEIEACQTNTSSESNSLCYSAPKEATTIFQNSSGSYEAGIIYGNTNFYVVKTSGKRTLIAVKARSTGTSKLNTSRANKCNSNSSYYCVWITSTCLKSGTKCCRG